MSMADLKSSGLLVETEPVSPAAVGQAALAHDNRLLRTIVQGLDLTVAEKDKEIAHLQLVIDQLEADKAELAKDERRMDWLAEHVTATDCRWITGTDQEDIREAVDKAMQSSQGGAREGKV